MNDAAKNAFLALVPAARAERAADALQVIIDAAAAGSILNVDFKDAKLTLDRAVEAAWEGATNHFWAGKAGHIVENDVALNDALNKLHWDVDLNYVRDAIAASKKLAKTLPLHSMVTAMRAAVSAVLPVAQLMEQVKGTIVKGRRPPTAEVLAERAARDASKVSMKRATCGCCFNEQAVLPNGKIHDHGYTLPSSWNKTASCEGRHFRPLEVSDEGPKHMVDLASKAAEHMVKHIAELKAAVTLEVATKHAWMRGHRVATEWKTIDTTNAQFEHVRGERVRETEYNLGRCRKDLAAFHKVVAEWKPGTIIHASKNEKE